MKQIIFISIFIFWNYLCFGATTFNTDSLQRRMSLFGTMLPQEKVYVHLDNTCYFVGDTIWYKGWSKPMSSEYSLKSSSVILNVSFMSVYRDSFGYLKKFGSPQRLHQLFPVQVGIVHLVVDVERFQELPCHHAERGKALATTLIVCAIVVPSAAPAAPI